MLSVEFIFQSIDKIRVRHFINTLKNTFWGLSVTRKCCFNFCTTFLIKKNLLILLLNSNLLNNNKKMKMRKKFLWKATN